MASFGAIAATSRAILGLLESAAPGHPEFAGTTFSLYGSADLQQPTLDRVAVSLYLYHVSVNTTRRNLTPRVDSLGRRLKPAIPLDLHYLLTAWSKEPGMQQRLFGWAVRVIQDTPTLPAAVLNQQSPEEVFRPDETVELIWENLSQQDIFEVWEVARKHHQPSATYVARILEIESTDALVESPLVQTRDFHYGEVTVP
ncbi:MAG: hypothetical protein QOH66_1544 [Actinomycetota bacterium]|nr:hypothetical protein [Actinomycetota bacterium]